MGQTDKKAGDDARLIIYDEAYDSLNITMIQRTMVDQCDAVTVPKSMPKT